MFINNKKIMKRFYYLVGLFLLFNISVYGQNVFFILTSTENEEAVRDIIKSTMPQRAFEKTPTIFFTLYFKGKFDYTFIHCDYNVEEAQRQLPYYRPDPEYDNHEIIMKPKSFLNEIEPVDLDVLFPTWTEADVEAFCDSLHRKKVYIIDRNDITNDSIKLIEVRYFKMLKF